MKPVCAFFVLLLAIGYVAADPLTRVLQFEHQVTDQALILSIDTTGPATPELVKQDNAELVVEFSQAICVPRSMILFNSSLVRRVRLEQHSHTPPVVRLILGLLQPANAEITKQGSVVRLQVMPKTVELPEREATKSRSGVERLNVSALGEPASPQPATPNPQPGIIAGLSLPRRLPSRVEATQAEASISHPLINVEMQDTDLRQLLRGIAKQDDIKLIIHDSVEGRVSTSLQGVTPLKAIQHILTANGYVYERADDYLIAATPDVIQNIVPLEWKVLPLQYAQATELQSVLQGLLSPHGSVQADARTNSLVLRDVPTNIQRYEQLVSSLDRPLQEGEQPTQTEVLFFEHAQIAEMESLVQSMLSSDGKVAINAQSNALVITDTPEKLTRIRGLTHQFESARQSANALATKIFHLKYVDANAILPNLEVMLSEQGKISSFVRQKQVLRPARQKANSSPYREGGVAVSNDSDEEEGVEKWSDTLVVTDNITVLAQVEQLVQELDTLGTQVSIEAQIVELNADSMQQFGIQWEATHRPSGSHLQSGPFQAITGAQVLWGKLSADAFENITGAIQALETQGKAKLLAHPRTTTLDNELAQLLVTDRIPILTLRETELASTTTYQYLDVGIILTVIPHVSENNDMLMEISAQVDSLKEESNDKTVPPVISSRVAHSRVRIANGNTLAIGGLTKEETVEKISGVPLLSRLPILGAIFRSKEQVQHKTDLLILITPKIQEGTEYQSNVPQI